MSRHDRWHRTALGRAALVDWVTVSLGIVATILVFRLRVNSAWVVVGGGLIGPAPHLFR